MTIEDKLLTRKKFYELVEYKVHHHGYDYIEACLEVCHENEFPLEDVNKLMSPPLFNKIQAEANRNRLMKVNVNTNYVLDV